MKLRGRKWRHERGDLKFKKLKLGEKVKNLRLMRRYTLRQVSGMTGLSIALLSQVENNAVSPPVATLLRIARALDVNIGYFFREEESKRTRSGGAQGRTEEVFRPMPAQHRESGYTYEALAYTKNSKHMEPFPGGIRAQKEGERRLFESPRRGISFPVPGAIGLSLRSGGDHPGGRETVCISSPMSPTVFEP